jgi:hypothetical protein
MHGLKCEPSGTFDRQAWQAKLVLLAEDVAQIPADLLERALRKLTVSSPYLPKASDLFTAAKAEMNAGAVKDTRPGTVKAAEANQRLAGAKHGFLADHLEYTVDAEDENLIKLDYRAEPQDHFSRIERRVKAREITDREINDLPKRWKEILDCRLLVRLHDDGIYRLRPSPIERTENGG